MYTNQSLVVKYLLLGIGQVAKIRKDVTSGFVLCSTGFGVIGGSDVNTVVLAKVSAALELEWTEVRALLELDV